MAKKKSTSILNIDLSGKAALCSKGEKTPTQIQLFLAGQLVTTDGRVFINDNPDRIIAEFTSDDRPIPIDVDHEMEISRAGPAYGWVVELENRDGELWATVEWTPKGTQAITSKEYRYLSPAFLYNDDGQILKLISVALTNKPALPQLKALASEQKSKPTKENEMDRIALCKKLGLPDDATDAQILAAIDDKDAKLKTALASSTAPSLNEFVPRADYNQVVKDRDTANTALASIEKQGNTDKATALVESGIENGQIAPASKDFYLSMCSKEGGLAEFEEFLKGAPKVVASVADPDVKVPDGDKTALTSQDKEVAAAMGITPEEFIEQRKLEAK